MIIATIIILVISNVFSWAFIMRLASEIRQQDIILNGLSDTFKGMSVNETNGSN